MKGIIKLSIALKIIKMRESVGWSQSELARRTGVTSSAISQIEKGDRDPSIRVIKEIAKAFHVFVSSIVDEESPSDYGEMRIFFRKFSIIAKLSEGDKKIILSIAKRLTHNLNKTQAGD